MAAKDFGKDYMGYIQDAKVVELKPMELKNLTAGQVRIEVKACSICGSDLHIYNGKHPSAKLPCAIGHEMAGVIVEVGEGVSHVKVGDRVVLEPSVTCGKCESCQRGEYSHCKEYTLEYRRGNGCMRKYFTANAKWVFEIPESVGFDEASTIESLAVAVHAVRRANISMGETVAVIGLGPIGLMVSALCAKLGATTIAGDLVDARLQVAQAMGVQHVINTGNEKMEDAVKRITGDYVDKSIECVGHEAALKTALNVLKMGGICTVMGVFENPDLHLFAPLFVAREITLQGSQAYCWDFEAAIAMASQLDMGKFVSHKFPMTEIQKAFDLAADRTQNAVKVTLYPDW